MRGNRDYNADLVWTASTPMPRSGCAIRAVRSKTCSSRWTRPSSSGIKLEEVSYVGGKALPDGTSMQFYLVGIRQQTRSDIDYQPYMFTLDRDGKIAKVQ